MNGRRLTDARISQALRSRLPDRADPALRERILYAAEAATQQRALPSVLGALSEADPVVRRRSLLIAAALLVAIALASAAAVGALRLLERGPVRELSLVPPAPSVPASNMPGPSTRASTNPSASIAPLIWNRASLDEDWPTPVRGEPDGGATVLPILLKTVEAGHGGDRSSTTTGGHFVDPSGDTGSAVVPWVDIKELTFCGHACLSIKLVSDSPPTVDPARQWIAYGVVADIDRDGVPDWRYGTDNMPVDETTGYWPHRWWRTDLHTGQTEMATGDVVWLPSGTMFYGGPERLAFGSDSTRGLVGQLPERFYAWASQIQDGRVVATDYAPDAGWLLPSPDAKP